MLSVFRVNAVLHNFSRQIARSQYLGRSIVGFYRNRSKNFQITYTASRFSLLKKVEYMTQLGPSQSEYRKDNRAIVLESHVTHLH